MNSAAEYAVPKAMSIEEIRGATLEDTTLQEVAKCIRSDRWHQEAPPGTDPDLLQRYKTMA